VIALLIDNKRNSVAILMAVFNGEYYLREQINSIIHQDYSNWRLNIRDDGSTDHSLKVIGELAAIEKRVVIINDECGNLGAAENFGKLIEYALKLDEAYFCFSDQDDFWMPNKLAKKLAQLKQLEKKHPGKPMLIHSDMMVVDQKLNMMASSFMDYQGIRHERENPLNVLLTQNFVTGCTILVNRALLEIALPVPKEALMHDWWLALCAAVFGHIGYIDEPLVKYRQHDSNEVGAKHFGSFMNPFSGKWFERWLEGRESLFQSMKQAEALAERIRQHDPSNPHLTLLEEYVSLQMVSPLERIKKIRLMGVHAQSSSRQTLLLSRLLLTPKDKYT